LPAYEEAATGFVSSTSDFGWCSNCNRARRKFAQKDGVIADFSMIAEDKKFEGQHRKWSGFGSPFDTRSLPSPVGTPKRELSKFNIGCVMH
jgi:hypothetical protein